MVYLLTRIEDILNNELSIYNKYTERKNILNFDSNSFLTLKLVKSNNHINSMERNNFQLT